MFFDFFPFLFYYSIAYGAWPSGKATGFDPVIRRFESFRPSRTNGSSLNNLGSIAKNPYSLLAN